MRTEANEIVPSFSPAGDFMIFHSIKAGECGIHVRPFPEIDQREWTISARGGYDARWSPGLNEILYRAGARRVMSVPFEPEPEFRPGPEQPVAKIDAHESAGYSLDLLAGGDRILVDRPTLSYTDEQPVVLVSDRVVELNALAGPGAE